MKGGHRRVRQAIRWVGVLALCGGAFAAGYPSVAVASTTAKPHIMLIVDENKEYGHIIGNTAAPYINSLASTYTSATNWYSVEHDSPRDYLDLISGSDQDLPTKSPPFSATTIVDELHSAGIPWQAYMENMPSDCYTGGSTSDGLYDSGHNPFRYLSNYASYCSNEPSEGVVPYPGASSLVSSLDGSSPPDFVTIIPNDCDNMHRGERSPCASDTTNQLIAAGDTWLQNNLGPILKSQWFQNDGVVVFTFDEGGTDLGVGTPPDDGSCASANNNTTGCGGHIATLVITPHSSGAFTGQGDLYGILRAMEEAYGVGLLGHSSGTADGDLITTFTTLTGTVTDASNNAPLAGATVTCTCATSSTTTNTSGQYSFAGLTAGSYSLTVSDPGYAQHGPGHRDRRADQHGQRGAHTPSPLVSRLQCHEHADVLGGEPSAVVCSHSHQQWR